MTFTASSSDFRSSAQPANGVEAPAQQSTPAAESPTQGTLKQVLAYCKNVLVSLVTPAQTPSHLRQTAHRSFHHADGIGELGER